MDKWYPLKAVCTPKTKKREAEEEENYSLQKEPTWLAAKVLQPNFDTWAAIFIFTLLIFLKEITSLQAYWILMLLSLFSVLCYSFHWEPLGSTVKLFSHAWEEGGLLWSFFDEYRLKIILASHDHSRATAELSLSKTSLAGNQTRFSSFAIVICPFFQGLPIGLITPSQQRIESDPERALCFQVYSWKE